MVSKAELVAQIAGAYEHLYDVAYLRTHPLSQLLVSDPALSKKERAWRLHDLLTDAIEDLAPGPGAPASSRERRHYRLMVLRYLDGAKPEAVAAELGVSRRHFYRERDACMRTVAGILWDRYVASRPVPDRPAQRPAVEQMSLSQLELLRLETARLAQADRYARIAEVLQGALSLLQGAMEQRGLTVESDIPASLPGVSIDKGLLRQILLAVFGYLIGCTEQATIRQSAQAQEAMVCLSLRVHPLGDVRSSESAGAQEQISTLREMAALGGAQVLPVRTAQRQVCGFDILLQTSLQRTVLVIDDNRDVVELFQRYLCANNYRVVMAQTAEEALEKARRLQPHVITLDLMMPEEDGWSLLPVLVNQPDTSHIPIIVCSVLKQKELALMLGAAAFLEKPITERALLSALQALDEA